MPFEKFDLENLNKERRKAIAKSIRVISVEELKALGGEVFRYAGTFAYAIVACDSSSRCGPVIQAG